MSEQVSASGPMYRSSQQYDRGLDPGMRRMVTILGGTGLAILAGIAAYSLTGHSRGGGVPVVQADPRPIRVKPENPGGMQVAAEEKPDIPGESRLAPGTEEPNPRELMVGPQAGKVAAPAAMQPRNPAVIVQLSAAKSEAEARAAWEKLAKKMPDLVGQRRPLYLKTDETGPAPWRLRTGGFTDPARAKAFCDQVKAKGGTCTLVAS